MATVLITGGSGLIGSAVRRAWDLPTEATVLDRSSGIDLLEPGTFLAAVETLRPEAVVHLAWSAGGRDGYRNSPDNDRWARVTFEVAQRCAELGIHFVGVGTVLDDQEPADEYTSAKADLRKNLTRLIDAGNVTWLRPFYVFSAEAGRPGVLGAAQRASATSINLALNSPDSSHDFVHVDDVASAIVTVVRGRPGGVQDVGSGELRTVADLVTAAGLSWHRALDSATVLHDHRTADTTRLLQSGWTPIATDRFFAHD